VRAAELLERFEELRRASCLMKPRPKCWSVPMFDTVFEAARRLWLGLSLIAATSGFLLLSDTKQRAGEIPGSRSSSSAPCRRWTMGLTDCWTT